MMAKTREELNALKKEAEAMDKKLHELTDEELEQITGGVNWVKFGQLILENGGENIPALDALVKAIKSRNWPLVAKITLSPGTLQIPVVTKAWKEAD